MKSTKKREKFVELRAKGLSYNKIAEELNVCRQTLVNWSKDLKDEIANLRAMELEALQQQYFVAKSSKIESFGSMLKRLQEELSSRTLDDVPTKELIELSMKISQNLEKERSDLVFTDRKFTTVGSLSIDEMFEEEVSNWKG